MQELRDLEANPSQADLIIARAFDRMVNSFIELREEHKESAERIERRLFVQTTSYFSLAGAIIIALIAAVLAG